MLELPKKFDTYPKELQDMFLKFKEIKESGNTLVGWACAYAPVELVMAAGAVPVCITTIDNATVSAAEKHLPKNLCPMITAPYGAALEELNPLSYYTDMIIVETSCDGRKKVYEKLGKIKPVHSMHLPQGIHATGSFDYWYKEMVDAKKALEETLGVEITDEKLREAIKETNEERRAAAEYYELGKLSPCPIDGPDMLLLAELLGAELSSAKRTEIIRKRTAELKEAYENGKIQKKPRPRILVTGCPLIGVKNKVLQTIEDCGLEVVMLENCAGLREKKDLINEEIDPLTAIAEKYMKLPCAVMTPNPTRLEDIGKYIDMYKVDGVIEIVLQACHPFGIEGDTIKEYVTTEKELPYLGLETDFSTADLGQVATRIGAFAELLM